VAPPTIERPDWSGYETQFRQAADHFVRAHVAMSRAMADARDVLTAEQRTQLEGSLAVMREVMQGHMQQMMGGMGPGMTQHDQHR
jgi:Spy/CpxP family protein refolding chaperone